MKIILGVYTEDSCLKSKKTLIKASYLMCRLAYTLVVTSPRERTSRSLQGCLKNEKRAWAITLPARAAAFGST